WSSRYSSASSFHLHLHNNHYQHSAASIGTTSTSNHQPDSSHSLQSLKPSNTSFRYIDGRRYHDDETSRYPLPNDDEEINRLQLQHYLFRYAWKDNFSSPVKEMLEMGGARVLDVGCGPATWILEMAFQFPSSEFIGVDFSPVFPTSIKPQNVELKQLNVLTGGLPFESDTFDFVYLRFMNLALTEKQWPDLMQEL
ncbi:17549_t:CDS:1, partial [Acaulospora morrowiae]